MNPEGMSQNYGSPYQTITSNLLDNKGGKMNKIAIDFEILEELYKMVKDVDAPEVVVPCGEIDIVVRKGGVI